MIHVLRHNLFGQRFDPREQQSSEWGQKHIHIHLHLNLHWGTRIRRAAPTSITRLTIIFAAFIGALSMALTLLIQTNARIILTEAPLFTIAGQAIFLGSVFGLCAVLAGGLPLIASVWQSKPSVRLRLVFPLLIILLLFAFAPVTLNLLFLLSMLLLLAMVWRPTWRRRFLFLLLPLLVVTTPLVSIFFHNIMYMPRGFGAMLLGMLILLTAIWRPTWRKRFFFLLLLLFVMVAPFLSGLLPFILQSIPPLLHFFGDNTVLAILLYGIPLVSTFSIINAMHQVHHSEQALKYANRVSRVVVLSMLLMFVGTVLWGFALALFDPAWFFALISLLTYPWNSWLLIVLGMLLAMLVALWAFFTREPTSTAQPRPHDVSLHDVAVSQQERERGYEEGYRGLISEE